MRLFLTNIILVISLFSGVSYSQTGETTDSTYIEFKSNPDSVRILVSNSNDTVISPTTTMIKSGILSFKAFKSGYDSIIYDLETGAERNIILNILLKTVKPTPLTVDEYGLEYEMELPLMDATEALKLRKKYITAAEIFMITPFAQGVMGKLIMGNDDKGVSDVLMISGAALTIGSLILGKILYARKQQQIKEFNDYATAENIQIKENNKLVDDQVKMNNRKMMSDWQRENRNRGTVIVTTR